MLELKTKINENNHQTIAKEILALQAVHSYLTTEKQSEYLKKKIMEEEQNENIRNQYVNEVIEIKENELIKKIDEKTAIEVAQINIPHDLTEIYDMFPNEREYIDEIIKQYKQLTLSMKFRERDELVRETRLYLENKNKQIIDQKIKEQEEMIKKNRELQTIEFIRRQQPEVEEEYIKNSIINEAKNRNLSDEEINNLLTEENIKLVKENIDKALQNKDINVYDGLFSNNLIFVLIPLLFLDFSC